MKFNRRKLLVLGTASMGTALAGHWVLQPHQPWAVSQENTLDLTSLYRSDRGQLEINLEAGDRTINLSGNLSGNLSDKLAQLMTYNRQIPGPRLEVNPGDKVRINFTNNLPKPTNIHYHGLHIPITDNADNIFLHIPAKEQFTYEFQIPPNHRSGLFWYHPHLHGLVAEQLFGGLAGLFIVRGELDEIPEIAAASEEFLILQDFALDRQGNRLSDRQLSIMTGREGNVITVNGKQNPNFTIPAGKNLRMRILNASPSRFYRLSLEHHPFHLIATDGGALGETIERDELLLTPGERADILIQANREPGQYRLLNLPYQRVRMGMMRGDSSHTSQVLATVSYEAKTTIPLPTKLIPIQPLPEAQQTRQFLMNHGMIMGQGMAFLFNGQSYRLERIDTSVQLDTVEDWELINTGMMDHPFHIHGNAFQILSRNGQLEPYRAWKDVVLVQPGETVVIRMAFRDFAGKTVYHCHVLDHEDLGMMGNLEIKT